MLYRQVERKIPPQDAVADVFGLQKLTAAYRPSIRAKSLELSKARRISTASIIAHPCRINVSLADRRLCCAGR